MLVVTAVAFAQALGFGWAYDDFAQIVNNETLLEPGAWGRAFTTHVWAFAPESAEARYYRPVFTLTLLVLRRIAGLQPWAWHAAALLLHLGAVAALWHVLKRLSGSAVAATLGALLFAIHPAKAESVAWVSGLTDPTAALLGLSAVACWQRERRALAASLFALALGSKETAIVFAAFPVALAAEQRRWREGALTAALWGAIAAAYLLLRAQVIGSVAPRIGDAGGPSTAFDLVGTYGEHLVLPLRSALTHPLTPHLGWAVAAFAVFGLASAWAGRARPLVWMGGLFLLPVLDVSLLQPDMLVQDRYLYLPSACWLGAAGWGLAELDRRRPGPLAGSVAAVVAVAWVALLSAHLPGWRDNRAVWERATEVAPDSGRAWLNRGIDLENAGALVDAEACYVRALELQPERAIVHFRLAFLLAERQELVQAAHHFDRAAELRPKDPMIRYEAARIEAHLGHPGVAEQHLTAALEAVQGGAVPGGGVTRQQIERLLRQVRGATE